MLDIISGVLFVLWVLMLRRIRLGGFLMIWMSFVFG